MPAASRNMEGSGADVVVVGGGVAGLSVARELARRGTRTTLVERARLGAEASWAAAGMLAPQVEADARDDFFNFACSSRDAYPAFADALREETGVDIELDCTGTLRLAFTEDDEREHARRFEWQRGAGLLVEQLDAAETRALEPALSARVRGALRFPREWQVENRRLCDALARACRLAGVRVLEETEARSLNVRGGRFVSVETSRGTFGAGAVVVACGAWSSLLTIETDAAPPSPLAPVLDANVEHSPRIEPVRGQILCYAMRENEPLVRHVVYGAGGYVVPRRDGRLLAGTTTERAGFDKSVTEEGRRAIRLCAEGIAPASADLKITGEWAGLRPRAEDDLPVLGASAGIENLFYATGHYRNGILLAPLTGALVAEMVMSGATPAPLAPFSPARFIAARRAESEGSCFTPKLHRKNF
ncbi:MAG: glycine oxidase ThiO [Acidobacteria bacterium]|nr:glycine oxidase ThiO [Acidobacteriota bacterium]MCA1642476.1 glycine oxidase ThiO [Acidobacteriota bacterium]